MQATHIVRGPTCVHPAVIARDRRYVRTHCGLYIERADPRVYTVKEFDVVSEGDEFGPLTCGRCCCADEVRDVELSLSPRETLTIKGGS